MNGRIVRLFLLIGFYVLWCGTLLAQERWVYRYNGLGSDWDGAYSVTTGPDDNLYIAGHSIGSGTSCDFTVVSLKPSGEERWLYTYNGSGNGDDWAWSITAGPDGNLYAAGYTEGEGTCEDFLVVSLSPSGTERWVYRYNGPGNDWDIACSIAAGPDGNVYAAGYSEGSETCEDLLVVSLSPSGEERWVYRYDGPGSGDDWAYSITAGPDSNLYAAGYSEGSGTYEDFFIVSLKPSGTERWIYRHNGPGNWSDRACSITAGPDGNLYAAGEIYGSGTSSDFAVVSLEPSGEERWIYTYNGPGNDWDAAYSIAAAQDGNLYAAGGSWGSATDYDLAVVSLKPSGAERWVYRYSGPGSGLDWAYSISADWDGNVYAVGHSVGSGTYLDLVAVSLMGNTVGPSAVATGGGWISVEGSGKKNFGFNTHSEKWKVWGQLQFSDHDKKMDVHSEAIDDIIVRGDSIASFAGTCRVDKKTGYTFTCVVGDHGEPGKGRDKFTIEIWDPEGSLCYSADALLGGGNIQIHTSDDRSVVRRESDESRSVVPGSKNIQNLRHEGCGYAEGRAICRSYPNPFQHSTLISYSLPVATQVTLSIYDLTGRLVETPVNEIQQPGIHQVRWDRQDNPSGVYFYRLEAGEFVETRKMVLVD
jgi:uncharacterized delta-60 repeat protein